MCRLFVMPLGRDPTGVVPRKDDELDAQMGLRTYNEIRKSRGLLPYSDPKFDVPILPAS